MNDKAEDKHHFRFHIPFAGLFSTFGDDWYGRKAEAFTRFYGTPFCLLVQTTFVVFWIVIHSLGVSGFDPYPFILLNLVFSIQSAYAAPLILLAQMRQADRDNAHAEADAQHKEALAVSAQQQAVLTNTQSAQLLELMEQNTRLTQMTKELTERIEGVTRDLHDKLCR